MMCSGRLRSRVAIAKQEQADAQSDVRVVRVSTSRKGYCRTKNFGLERKDDMFHTRYQMHNQEA